MEGLKLVELKSSDPTEALKVIDDLRQALADGKVVCFCAVGIAKDDATTMWYANVGGAKTNLQLVGALTNLQLGFWSGRIAKGFA